MDLKYLAQKLDRELTVSSTLKPFGRTEQIVLDVKSEDLAKVAGWLRMEESARLDWLENLSCFESKSKLVLSYFLRSQILDHALIVRCELSIPEGEKVSVTSVASVWPMVHPYEQEIASLFGVEFKGNHSQRGVKGISFAEGAYPLRKSYVWEEVVL